MPRVPVRERQAVGPGLIPIVVGVIAVAILSARLFGFWPGGDSTTPPSPGPGGERARPVVVIYHTHTSENFAPKPTHARGGAAGDIVAVGSELAAELQARGVEAVHVRTVHDDPWSEAFEKARGSLAEVLARYESVAAVIDLHRDAIAEKPVGYTLVQSGDANYAKLLFIVGDLENPLARANTTFAESLRGHLEDAVPGVTRGVKIVTQQTNGDLHPNAVMVHIGDYSGNSLEEANASTRLLADAIAQSMPGIE